MEQYLFKFAVFFFSLNIFPSPVLPHQTLSFVRPGHQIVFRLKKNNTNIYKSKKGDLVIRNRYLKKTILKGLERSKYYVQKFDKNIFLISQINDQGAESLYYVKDEKWSSPVFLGKGYNPFYHSSLKVVTFLTPSKNKIFISNLQTKKIAEVHVFNSKNEFSSNTTAITGKHLFYTDSKKNTEFVNFFDIQKQQKKKIFKTSSPQQKLEICQVSSNVYVLLGSYNEKSYRIFKISLKKDNPVIDKIYQSEKSSIGGLYCRDSLFFLEKFQNNSYVVSFEPTSRRIKRLTQSGSITGFFPLEDELVYYENGDVKVFYQF